MRRAHRAVLTFQLMSLAGTVGISQARVPFLLIVSAFARAFVWFVKSCVSPVALSRCHTCRSNYHTEVVSWVSHVNLSICQAQVNAEHHLPCTHRLKYFEEAFTSEHWMMRIYRVRRCCHYLRDAVGVGVSGPVPEACNSLAQAGCYGKLRGCMPECMSLPSVMIKVAGRSSVRPRHDRGLICSVCDAHRCFLSRTESRG